MVQQVAAPLLETAAIEPKVPSAVNNHTAQADAGRFQTELRQADHRQLGDGQDKTITPRQSADKSERTVADQNATNSTDASRQQTAQERPSSEAKADSDKYNDRLIVSETPPPKGTKTLPGETPPTIPNETQVESILQLVEADDNPISLQDQLLQLIDSAQQVGQSKKTVTNDPISENSGIDAESQIVEIPVEQYADVEGAEFILESSADSDPLLTAVPIGIEEIDLSQGLTTEESTLSTENFATAGPTADDVVHKQTTISALGGEEVANKPSDEADSVSDEDIILAQPSTTAESAAVTPLFDNLQSASTVNQPTVATGSEAGSTPLASVVDVADIQIQVQPSAAAETDAARLVALTPAEFSQVAQRLASELATAQGQNAKPNEFIAALQAGVTEAKAQLEQGGAAPELQQLVESALQKASAATENGTAVSLTQVAGRLTQQFQQLLGEANGAGRSEAAAQVQGLTSLESRASADVSQLQSETQKVTQQTNSAFDKAVNLAKPEAAQQLADKVRFSVNQRNLVADIRLDPAELGSLQVRVQVQGDQASVNFTVQNQQAKELLEQATPKLRELLSEKGIELGQSSVQQEQGGEAGQSGDEQRLAGGGEPLNAIEEQAVIDETRVVNGHLGAIDYFA